MRYSMPNGWTQKKLVDIADVQTGIAKGKKNISDPITRPYLRVANVQDGHLDLNEVKTIEIARHEIERYSLQEGDVLFTEGGDFDKLGRGTVWRGEVPNCLHQNHVFAVRIKDAQMLPYFLTTYASSFWGRTYFLSCSKQTTNLASINSTQLKQMPLPLPPLPEQREIAAILSTWDRAIELTEKLIAAKQRRKQALMQQLLTGKAAPIVPLSHFLTPTSYPVPKPDKAYTAVGIRSHCKGTFQRSVGDPSSVAMDTLYAVKASELIVNITFAWEGAIAVVKPGDEGCLVSHRFPTYAVNAQKADLDFVRHLVTTTRFVFQLGFISPGGAGRNRVLSKKDFMKLKVHLPGIEEQRRLGRVLMTATYEITLLLSRLDALKQQKKGLMQQLLTGKVRVSLSDREV